VCEGISSRKEIDRPSIRTDFLAMTAKAKAAINQFQTEQFALRDKVAVRLQKLSSAERLKMLVSAGVLTKKGKLTPSFRPKRVAA
jgi:hypothetical protein